MVIADDALMEKRFVIAENTQYTELIQARILQKPTTKARIITAAIATNSRFTGLTYFKTWTGQTTYVEERNQREIKLDTVWNWHGQRGQVT